MELETVGEVCRDTRAGGLSEESLNGVNILEQARVPVSQLRVERAGKQKMVGVVCGGLAVRALHRQRGAGFCRLAGKGCAEALGGAVRAKPVF